MGAKFSASRIARLVVESHAKKASECRDFKLTFRMLLRRNMGFEVELVH